MITLIITTILLAIFTATTIVIYQDKKKSNLGNRFKHSFIDKLENCQLFCGIFGFIGILFFIFTFTIIRVDTHAFIKKKHSIENTIKHSSSNEIENAAMIQNVISYNQSLKTRKYYANIWSFTIYHPDDIYSVEPIRLDSLSRKN